MPAAGPIWCVGAGNMAGALLRGWLAAGLSPARLTVIRPSGAAVAPGVRVLTAPPVDEPPPTLLLLGVKPQLLDAVAPALTPHLGRDTLLLSILAGVETAALRARFAAPARVLRAMPNLAVAIGRGVVALHGSGLAREDEAAAATLMAPLGLVEWIGDEALFDAVTALAGSGPAFLYRFIDALAAAGAAAGLPDDQAARLALATVDGAARLAAGAAAPPAELAARVASEGGSTRAGLDVLDGGEALTDLVERTIAAAVRRNAELAAMAR